MHYSSDEDEDDESEEGLMYSCVKRRQHNRRYDGSRCYCKPCPECHGVWIPDDSYFGTKCTDCPNEFGFDHFGCFVPTMPNKTSEIEEFLARNAAARARDHWMFVRRFLFLRATALWWLEQAMRPTADNRAPPGRLAAFADDF